MASHKKRERTQNWTPEEKIMLLKLCGYNINILESKKADQYSLTIKNNVWRDIHREFISELGTDRDILRLKEQWQRMKKQARSELQEYKLRSKSLDGSQQMRKISHISEEVLKIMQLAHRNSQEEDNISFGSSENSERDNTPTYFCETEVKQEIEDINENNQHRDFISNDYEASLSSLEPLLQFSNKNEAILNILTNLCQTSYQNDVNENQTNSNKRNKRKIHNIEESQFLQTLFESKHKEHKKKMLLIDEQLKTAKLQRETAEINKKIAQQELKSVLLKNSNQLIERNQTLNLNTSVGNNKNNIKDKINEEILQTIQFHKNQIKELEDSINQRNEQSKLLNNDC